MTAPQISIEQVDPRIPPIVALVAALDSYMGELYPAESNHLTDLETLAGPDARFFAARVDGEYRGCGAILICGGYGEIKRIYVAPEARGLGLAGRMMRRLEDEARVLGLPLLRIETGIHQPDALRLFERAGFSKCGAFGDYSPDDPYSVFLEKQLAPQ
ncbi:GNAT family N-acetyltransferase [Chelativorans sp.]|uniref:GNAT family N-acetyltransferase n=1 Tax=Chelativorans sp. TaxID=2203393 RepID=UPI0028117AB4|nr:GNAT family N-acetyltransferase [Chelativorans sp.]